MFRNDPAAFKPRLRRRVAAGRKRCRRNGEGDAASALPISDHSHHGQSWIDRLRLRAQFARDTALSLPGGLLRALCHEQSRRFRAHSGRRLRRDSRNRRRRAQKYFPRICRQRDGWFGGILPRGARTVVGQPLPVAESAEGKRDARRYNSSTASRISSIVTSVDNRAEPIFDVTTKRIFPASNFLSNGSASRIFSRGKFAGSCVGNSNVLKRSRIASR